ncbi:hypothetical protein [Cellulomonas persica]|nr:hypothetical protein [Cellulomonas persica]
MRWWGRGGPDEAAPPQDDVLELRVHGVANTPPAAMLDVRPDQVEQVDGDDLGSFWTPTSAVGSAPRKAGDARVVPPGVRREAYSWGAMARFSTVPGLGRASGIVAGVVRVAWVVIVPFGLANVAYWARDADEPHGPRSSAGGGLVRLFGLALTLLWVTTAATVSLGIVAAQCYGPRTDLAPDGPDADVQFVQVCTALPEAADVAARWSTGVRSAVILGLTALVVVALGAIGSTGRLRYERRMSTTKARQLVGQATSRAGRQRVAIRAAGANGGREQVVAPGDDVAGRSEVWPMLARRGFWTHADRSSVQWFQHLAAAFATLAGLVAWHYLYRDAPGCARSEGFGARGCLSPGVWAADGRLPWAALLVASVAVVVVAAFRTGRFRLEPPPRARGDQPRAPRVSRASDAALLCAALAVLLAVVIAVARSGDDPLRPVDPAVAPLLGLHALPRLLVAVMVLLVIAAVGIRARLRARIWVPLTLVVLVGATTSVLWPDGTWSVVSRSVGGLALVALVVVAWTVNRRHAGREREGWSGRGPAVLLSTAAGVAMVLSAATVLGVAAWLDAPAAAENQRLSTGSTAALEKAAAAEPLRDPVVVHVPAPERLHVPPGYEQFAVASVAVLALLAAFVVVLAVRMGTLRRKALPVVPGDVEPDPERLEDVAVQTGRRHAALAQRAERLMGALGLLFFLALVATLVLPDPHAAYDGPFGGLWTLGVDLSRSAVVAGCGLIVASVVLAGSKQPLARPWGLLWDLMCFLPRAAHPFAPPCYAERVVPELRSRIDAWLGDDGTPIPASQRDARRVLLSAHSLGGVVCVATLMARWDGPAGPYDHRVGLLTYGTQLRAYFGRFFPELFGPAVLGTRPSTGARLWAPDPWAQTEPGLVPSEGPTLRASLSPPDTATADEPTHGSALRWRSLWRRTDFIGFPVDAYAGSAVDAPASEIDADAYLLAVAAHSGYPRAPEYRRELDLLVARLRASTPGRPVTTGR